MTFKVSAYLLIIALMIISSTGKKSGAQNLLNGPQKIVVDYKRNVLLVSNGNTGDLVQIDSIGNQCIFVENADFIDGIEIVGDTVFGVGNNRKIRAYNLENKRLVYDITLPGDAANYLSSIAADSMGHIFISCPLLNEIYRMNVSNGSYHVFTREQGLNKPNGILLERGKNRIVVIDDSPNSTIHAVSLSDSTVTTLFTTTLASPDGIISDPEGNYYIGGYYLQGLYKTDSTFKKPVELVVKGLNIVYPTIDKRNNSILITHYNANTWERIFLE